VNRKSAVHDGVRDSIRALLASTLGAEGSGVPAAEAEALTDICMMGIGVSGKENPREMARLVSDGTLDGIVGNHEAVRRNPVVGRVFQIFLVEWCYRKGHLECDWAWKWASAGEGSLFYKSGGVPLDRFLPVSGARRIGG